MTEVMAAKVHDIWCSWMQSVFNRSIQMPNGNIVIPKALVDRWRRQAVTPYDQLPKQERQSDITIADSILDLLQKK